MHGTWARWSAVQLHDCAVRLIYPGAARPEEAPHNIQDSANSCLVRDEYREVIYIGEHCNWGGGDLAEGEIYQCWCL